MGKLFQFIDDHLEEYIASLLFVVFTVLMFCNVVMRYVFQDSIPWAEEIILLLFIWFVWFSIPFATKLDSHAKVTFVQDWLPDRVKALVNILLVILTIVLFISIIVAAIEFLNHNAVKGKTGLLIPYPMWVFYLPAPIGLGLTVYRLLSKLKKDFYTLIHSSMASKGI